MNYIELINQFWSIRRYKPMTAYEADFYFFLLKECNMRNWLSPFELPTRLIYAELGYSNKTISDLRNRLKQKGLIDFIEGNRREKAASYIILVSERNQNGNQSSNQNGNQSSNQNGNPLNTKHKQKQKEDNNSNELFPLDITQKPKRREKKEFMPPTIEEVKSVFMEKLPDWEIQAETFFYHYDSLGWKTVTGAKVQRWDSMANKWIIEKLQTNGNKRQTDNDTCSDTIIRSTPG